MMHESSASNYITAMCRESGRHFIDHYSTMGEAEEVTSTYSTNLILASFETILSRIVLQISQDHDN